MLLVVMLSGGIGGGSSGRSGVGWLVELVRDNVVHGRGDCRGGNGRERWGWRCGVELVEGAAAALAVFFTLIFIVLPENASGVLLGEDARAFVREGRAR